jgi:hypothetical protein
MALESVTHVADLTITNPVSSDAKSQGDDHIRNLKVALRNNFAGFTGNILVSGTDGGSANTYTLTPTTTLTAYSTKMIVEFTPNATNTGASTLNISALGAKNIYSVAGVALASGDLVSGCYYLAVYDGTQFRLLSTTKNYVDQLAFATALPAQSLGLLKSTGSVASFGTELTGFALDEVKGANIASAATINLTTATGNFVHVTGTTTITAITIPSGAERTVIFDGILTLTHNATTLILPGAANITTAANDRAIVRGDAGNAIVVSYVKASGLPVVSSTPGLTLLATLTPTAAANVDFLTTFTSTYDNYLIIGDGLKPASDDALRLRYAVAGTTDTGSSYFSGATGASATATTAITVTAASITSAGLGCGFTFEVQNANDATNAKTGSLLSMGQNAATPTFNALGQSNAYNAANTISGFRLYWSGGANFSATGKVRVYGYSNT